MEPWPYFDQEVIDRVSEVLRSGKVNQWTGEEVKLFEKEFAEYVGTKYAIALSNGTVALELALYALDIGSGDEVIVTPRTFIASANCIMTRGALPVFVDVDRETGNISLETIMPHITSKTKAIICVHLAGVPCDMDPIMSFAKERKIWVIEDCAQAHGATYKGKQVGSIGHIGAWSFCQDKIITTGGEGGAITLNDELLFKKAWSFKDHGKDYDIVNSEHEKYKFRWLHTVPGTNMRMTEMQAVIGRVFLKRLDAWIFERKNNAMILDSFLSDLSIVRLPKTKPEFSNSYYKYYCYINPDRLKEGWTRDRVVAEINDIGFPCFSGSCSEIYLERTFDNIPLKSRERLPVAKELGETSLMFLVHPTISEENMNKYALHIKEVLSQATK